jgi:small subunit ribosomal protein S21
MSIKGRRVIVTDGNVEKALRKFKKKITDQNLLQELREREQYVKPSIQRKVDNGLAKRRWQKYLRDQSLPKKLF